jgi:hypothetical protein
VVVPAACIYADHVSEGFVETAKFGFSLESFLWLAIIRATRLKARFTKRKTRSKTAIRPPIVAPMITPISDLDTEVLDDEGEEELESVVDVERLVIVVEDVVKIPEDNNCVAKLESINPGVEDEEPGDEPDDTV